MIRMTRYIDLLWSIEFPSKLRPNTSLTSCSSSKTF